VPKDEAQAFAWWLKAAQQSEPLAQYSVAQGYKFGLGVTANPPEAVAWYVKAAEHGAAPAQADLGILYMTGDGVAPNAVEAVAWFRKSAAQGDPSGLLDLGQCYLIGRGVAADYLAAYELLSLAVRAGRSDVSPLLDKVRAQVSPDKLGAANAFVAAWRPGAPLPGAQS